MEFHDVFLGGASVLLDVAKRHPHVRLHGNDRDPGIAALWTVVSGPERGDLQRLVRATTPTLELREHWKARIPEGDLEAAFQVLYLNRTSFSGNLTGGRLGGPDIGARWRPLRICGEIERIHALLQGRVEIYNENATDYLGRLVGRDGAVVYIDPPYYGVGNQLYRVGMSPEEHQSLAARVRELDRWVVSYDDVPAVHNLYDWAVRLPVAAKYSVARSRAARQELLIVPEGHPAAGPGGQRGGVRASFSPSNS